MKVKYHAKLCCICFFVRGAEMAARREETETVACGVETVAWCVDGSVQCADGCARCVDGSAWCVDGSAVRRLPHE